MEHSAFYWVFSGLVLVPLLVALNGFFVAAEFALVAVRKTRVEEMVNNGVAGSSAVAAAVANLDRAIAATQLGITLASIALGWVGEPALAWLIEPVFFWLPGVARGAATHTVATALAFSVITFLHVVFGELVPKSIALQIPDQTSLWVARPLLAFDRITRPLITLMNGTGNWIVRKLGFRVNQSETELHSVEELMMLIEDTEEAGMLDPEQAELVENVFSLSDKTVNDCMVPRDKMASLDIGMNPDQIMAAVRDGAHTRMPVFDGDPDKVVGVVNTKDLFFLFSLKGVVVLEDALYPAIYLEPTESIANALRLLKRSRKPMALVRDEGNKILGLITLEDVVEEIVGDIEDEHDRPTRKLRFVRRRTGVKGLR